MAQTHLGSSVQPSCGSWWITCTDKKLMLPAVLWLTGSLSLGQKSPVFCQHETVAVATRLKPQALHSLWQSQFFHYLDALIVILLYMKITNNKNICILTVFKDNHSQIDHILSQFSKKKVLKSSLPFEGLVCGLALKAYWVMVGLSVSTPVILNCPLGKNHPVCLWTLDFPTLPRMLIQGSVPYEFNRSPDDFHVHASPFKKLMKWLLGLTRVWPLGTAFYSCVSFPLTVIANYCCWQCDCF